MNLHQKLLLVFWILPVLGVYFDEGKGALTFISMCGFCIWMMALPIHFNDWNNK